MTNCKKCSKEFSRKIIIDGKEVYLATRKKCYDCSPYSPGHTQSFKYFTESYDQNNCIICNKPNITSISKTCKSCSVNCRRYEKKSWAIEYMGGKCKNCGYNECPANLVFHHINPKEKEFNISATRSYDSLKKELSKCIMLCHNCHGKLHWDEGNENRQKMIEAMRNRINEIKTEPKKIRIRKTKINWPSKDELIKLISEKSVKKLSKELGVSHQSIFKRCKKIGINISDGYWAKKVPKSRGIKIVWPSNDELEKLVWEKPVVALAKELGVSDKAIAKHCKKYNIHIPGRGYWAKLRAKQHLTATQ